MLLLVVRSQEIASKEFIFKIFPDSPRRKNPCMVLNNICLCRGAIAMSYYGLSLNSGNLVGDIFINFLVQGAIEIPAILFTMLTLNRIGRKGPHVFSIVLSGLSCLATIFVVFFADECKYHSCFHFQDDQVYM
jgi:hypothetical protein